MSSLARSVWVSLLLLAVLLQAQIEQTHIHPLPGFAGGLAHSSSVLSPEMHAPGAPSGEEKCALCLIVAHASVFGAPSAHLSSHPFGRSEIPPFPQSQVSDALLLEHDARQRGPPSR